MPVTSAFLIKYSAVAVGKTGKPYMNLILMDKTGEVEARIWDNTTQYMGHAVQDSFVLIEGHCQSYQGKNQLVIKKLQVLREDLVDPKEFIKESPIDPQVLYSKLLAWIASIKDPYYRALGESIFRDDPDIAEKMKRAPAAKNFHHSYRTGLLEHVVSISTILDFLSQHYATHHVNRDLMLMGGFLHDIGKLWELCYERVTDYTTEGRLIGHLVMGIELVDRKIHELEQIPERLPGLFPEEKKLLLKHVILAHHGELEFGSPKRPKCMEALLVHVADDMDSKMNAIHSFMEQDSTLGHWTAFSRQYERFFYKPEPVQE